MKYLTLLLLACAPTEPKPRAIVISEEATKYRRLAEFYQQETKLLVYIPAIWPTKGWITSGFGARRDPYSQSWGQHLALDISGNIGQVVVAPANGTVIYAGWEDGYGNTLSINHGNGIVTKYGHLSSVLVNKGDVTRGQPIAKVGTTGRSTGPHLHYEIIINGKKVNPKLFLLDD